MGKPDFLTFNETLSSNMSGDDLYTKVFSVKTGSQAIHGGTDGKDVGVRGGQYPWPASTFLNGDPGLPKVRLVEVLNSVTSGCTLKINLNARSASTKK